MNENRGNHKERGEWPDDQDDQVVFRIRICWYDRQGICGVSLQFGSSQYGCEDGTHANGTEVTSKKRLSPCFDVWYQWLKHHHDWNAAEEDNHDGNDDQSPRSEPKQRVIVLFPWYDGAKVDEVRQIEQ